MIGRAATAALVLAISAGTAGAQQAPATLSLEEAVALAREHNPQYRAQLNDEGVADWSVRSAYASLLPSASASGGVSYQSGGAARIGGFTSDDIGLGTTPDYYYSSYSLSIGLGLSGADFYRLGQEQASRRALVSRLDASSLALEANVTRQYLAALRMRDAVDLARAELERAEANLALAEARYAVESATAIEAKQARVEVGRAEVELLRAQAGFEGEKLGLLQLIGVDLDRGVELTTEVTVFEPRWDLESLLTAAAASHPELAAARASAASAESGVAMARTAYWPSLSLSTGFSGYTRRASSDGFLIQQRQDQLENAYDQCLTTNDLLGRLNPPLPPDDCSKYVFTDEMRAEILEQNSQFPFRFQNEPLSVSLGLSLPIFQGLSRQRQVQSASAQAEDARLQVRGEELRVRAEVERAHLNLRAAYDAVLLEERNRDLADDQLRLARERYRVGAASYVELREAETLKARADRAYLLGLYAFQEALTALEAAVGQDLATPEN